MNLLSLRQSLKTLQSTWLKSNNCFKQLALQLPLQPFANTCIRLGSLKLTTIQWKESQQCCDNWQCVHSSCRKCSPNDWRYWCPSSFPPSLFSRFESYWGSFFWMTINVCFVLLTSRCPLWCIQPILSSAVMLASPARITSSISESPHPGIYGSFALRKYFKQQYNIKLCMVYACMHIDNWKYLYNHDPTCSECEYFSGRNVSVHRIPPGLGPLT